MMEQKQPFVIDYLKTLMEGQVGIDSDCLVYTIDLHPNNSRLTRKLFSNNFWSAGSFTSLAYNLLSMNYMCQCASSDW